MSDVNIDWKGKALAAEAETLNLKNLCAHHGICTVCGEYYSHHYTEPFATCKCNTSEWYEITEYMKLQDELRKLREQKPFGRYVKIIDPIDKNKHTYGVDYYSGFYVADLLDKEVYAAPVPAPDVPNDIIPEGDDFNGTTPHLIQCIESLVRLDAKGVLVPHGIGRDASKLLTAAANRLRQQAPAVPEEWRVLAAMCVDSLDAYERIGPGCQLDGCDMIHASILEELGEKARALLQSTAPCNLETMGQKYPIDEAKYHAAMNALLQSAPQSPAVPELDPMNRLIVSDPKQPKPPQQATSVPKEWRDVMSELAADLQSACDAEHPHRDQYPSIMRKYNNDMKIVEKARALLQSAEVRHD